MSSTLRERIAEALRESIIKGELRPGSRLQEVDIAVAYNTSRTPVREAFRQLETEGFLQIRSRRGAFVTQVTPKDVREFYELKSVLESYAAKQAVTRLTDADIDRMSRLNRELKRLYEEQRYTEMIAIHNEFHEIFVRACGNDRLTGLITSLVKQFIRFRIAVSHTDAILESIEVHDRIIRAFRERDGERVAELVAHNSAQGANNLIQRMQIQVN
ncbi:GntR family transcriptional regulator [bacterium]|nr:GntR family transcriptional regulator [bacterium]